MTNPSGESPFVPSSHERVWGWSPFVSSVAGGNGGLSPFVPSSGAGRWSWSPFVAAGEASSLSGEFTRSPLVPAGGTPLFAGSVFARSTFVREERQEKTEGRHFHFGLHFKTRPH